MGVSNLLALFISTEVREIKQGTRQVTRGLTQKRYYVLDNRSLVTQNIIKYEKFRLNSIVSRFHNSRKSYFSIMIFKKKTFNVLAILRF